MVAVFRLTGFASAASLTGTFCALVALSVHDRSPAIAAFGVLTMVLIAWKHRANIERLRAGTENKLSLTRRPTGTQGHG